MSESVSGVDAIVAGLREKSWWTDMPTRSDVGQRVVEWADAEAAVHATVRGIEAHLRTVPPEQAGTFRFELNLAADEVARRFGAA